MFVIKEGDNIKVNKNSSINLTSKNSKVENLCNMFFSIFSFKNKKNIAVLRLEGVIGGLSRDKGLSLEGIRKDIDKAFNMPKLGAVCLLINSPGGSPVQSELIATRIIELAKEKQIAVYSFIEDIAASGGYFLSVAADKIYASNSSIIGSIGVVSKSFGMEEIMKKIGIERRIYTQGKNKSFLDPFMPVKTQDIKTIKRLQQAIYTHFVNFIKSRRKGCLNHHDDILFNGDIWAGEQAYELGLIDGIDSFHNFIRNNFDNNVKIKYIEKKESWIKRKFGISFNIADAVENIVEKVIEKIKYNNFHF